MPIDDLTALGQKMREARKKKRPDTAGACGSKPCICQADCQHRKGKDESVLLDFEGIGKGAAHFSGLSDQPRYFPRR